MATTTINALTTLILSTTALPESTSQHGAQIDVFGAVLAAAVVMLVLPLVQGRD